jgi:hypothetical protein
MQIAYAFRLRGPLPPLVAHSHLRSAGGGQLQGQVAAQPQVGRAAVGLDVRAGREHREEHVYNKTAEQCAAQHSKTLSQSAQYDSTINSHLTAHTQPRGSADSRAAAR